MDQNVFKINPQITSPTQILDEENVISKIDHVGKMFKSGLLQQANEIGLDIQVTGPSSMPYLTFKGCLMSEGILNLF